MNRSESSRSGDPQDFTTENLISSHNRLCSSSLPLAFIIETLSFFLSWLLLFHHLNNNHSIHVPAYKDREI